MPERYAHARLYAQWKYDITLADMYYIFQFFTLFESCLQIIFCSYLNSQIMLLHETLYYISSHDMQYDWDRAIYNYNNNHKNNVWSLFIAIYIFSFV